MRGGAECALLLYTTLKEVQKDGRVGRDPTNLTSMTYAIMSYFHFKICMCGTILTHATVNYAKTRLPSLLLKKVRLYNLSELMDKTRVKKVFDEKCRELCNSIQYN